MWIDRFLEPRSFDIMIDGRRIGSTTMNGGSPQGSPLSPVLFSICMSHVITEAQQQLDILDTRQSRKQHKPLSFVDACNSVRVGNKKNMDRGLEEAGERRKVWAEMGIKNGRTASTSWLTYTGGNIRSTERRRREQHGE